MGFLNHCNAADKGTSTCVLANLALGVALGVAAAHVLPCVVPKKKTGVKGDKLSLYYFDIPALAEPIRLVLELGGFDWEDKFVGNTEHKWPEFKKHTKWGQVPMLKNESTGESYSQTQAILRMLSKEVRVSGGAYLYPTCSSEAFLVDEVIAAFEDARAKIVPTFSIKDQTEKETARKALCVKGGGIYDMYEKIEEVVSKLETEWLVSDSLTMADLWCFFAVQLFGCGFLDGVPKGAFDGFKKLNRICRKVATVPEIQTYYSKKDVQKSPLYASFVALSK